MAINVNALSVLNLTAAGDLDQLQAALEAAGFSVFSIDVSAVHDDETFTAAVLAGLPVPKDARADGFDALKDHLRVGLAGLDSSDVAFIWLHTEAMLDGALATLLDAVDIFVALSRQVYSPAETNFPRRIRLLTFLTGSGPNFPSLTGA